MRAPRFLIGLALIAAWAAAAAAQSWDLTIDAPPALEPFAREIERIDPAPLALALSRAGLEAPRSVHVTLVADDDSLARRVAPWIVGQAFGTSDVVIFPRRVSSYPYGSLETVFRHEVVHLALSSAAGGGPLPRWFHEGVAVSIESDWSVVESLRLLLAVAAGPNVSEVGRLFASDSQPETATAYLLAAALVDDIRRRHGPGLPGLIAAEVATGVPFELAFVRQTRETPDEAAAQAWATYRRISAWLPVATSGTAVWTFILCLAFLAFAMRLRQRARRRWDDEEPEEDDEGRPIPPSP